MALESGTYIIASKSEDSYVGRRQNEDKSLLPKRVVLLPKGVEAPKWEIEALPDDNYILKIGGGFAADIDEQLFAILIDEPQKVLWKINPQKHQGEDTYTIVLTDRPSQGWVVPTDSPEEDKQIAVRTLIVGPSFPPFFPPTELFRVIPA